MASEAPQAVMRHCDKCGRERRWEPDRVGDLQCLGCKEERRKSTRRTEGLVMIGLVIAIAAMLALTMR